MIYYKKTGSNRVTFGLSGWIQGIKVKNIVNYGDIDILFGEFRTKLLYFYYIQDEISMFYEIFVDYHWKVWLLSNFTGLFWDYLLLLRLTKLYSYHIWLCVYFCRRDSVVCPKQRRYMWCGFNISIRNMYIKHTVYNYHYNQVF